MRPVLSLLALAVAASSAAHAQAPKPAAPPPAAPAPAAPAPAAPSASVSAPNPSAPSATDIGFEKYRLKNGLEVILHQDRSLPLIAVNLWYHVGPSSEPRGRSGFAHLFEHLMFEGSRHVGPEFDRLLESAGATNVNGTTSWDRTNYFETVPREHLELVLWIESDRMGYMLDTLTQESLDVQRGVVQNERRQTYENAPYGPSTLALLDALFPEGHPYHGAVIGSMKDLEAAKLEDVKSFFQAYYAPSNATLAIAGDFDGAAVKQLIERYFGTLTDRPRPKRERMVTPPLTAAKRLAISEPVQLGRIAFGWIAPPAFGPDEPALHLLAGVLAGGKATRLYRELVVSKKVASEVDAEVDANELASIVTVSAVAASGKTAEQLERELDAVLAAVSEQGPTAAELDRARRRMLLGLKSELQLLNGPGGESGRAGLLQRFNHYLGDPGYLKKWIDRINAVTPDDVRKAARQHLAPGARVVVVTQPAPAAKKEGAK
jgi:zinc protease